MDIANVLADGVGGPLVPVGGFVRLLGGQDLDKAAAKGVELVGVGDVAVQAYAQELCEKINRVAAAVDAVADGYVDQAVFAGDRDRRLAAQHGQGKEPRTAAAAQNQTQHFVLHAGTEFPLATY